MSQTIKPNMPEGNKPSLPVNRGKPIVQRAEPPKKIKEKSVLSSEIDFSIGKQLPLMVFLGFLLIVAFLFFTTLWNIIIAPIFMAKKEDFRSFALPSNLAELSQYMQQRIDLTDTMTNVTLDSESKSSSDTATKTASASAEIINGSGIAGE